MKEPDQAIHDEVFRLLGEEGWSVYPFLPEEGVAYPFVVLGVTRTLPQLTKSRLVGSIRLDVHFWNGSEDRRWVSDAVGRARGLCGQIRQLDGRRWLLREARSEIVRDTSTDEVLYHGVLELEYRFI